MAEQTTGPEADRAQKNIRVFLLDDHEVVRRGVRDLLQAEPGLQVIGEADSATQALARIPALKPHVAVLDIRLPDGDGVTVCRELRSRMPELACLMLTSFNDDDALFDAVIAGASGYVLKHVHGDELINAIRIVASGQSMLDPATTARMLTRLRERATKRDPLAVLTQQEHRVLELIGQGMTNRQIGEQMFLTEKTVKNYVSNMLTKLGMQRRTQVAILATDLRHDKHDPEDPRPR